MKVRDNPKIGYKYAPRFIIWAIKSSHLDALINVINYHLRGSKLDSA